MVRRLLAVAAVPVAFALGGGSGEAQSPPPPDAGKYSRVEIAVLGGYRFESALTFQGVAPYESVDVEDAPTWGVTLGWNYGPHSEVEIQYSHASPQATAIAKNPGSSDGTFEIGIDDIQLAWLGNFYAPQKVVRPYFGIGLGATLLDPNQELGGDSNLKVSISFSVGVKVYFSDHVGLRAEVHYIPAYLYTTGTGVEWCFGLGGTNCWNTGDRYLQQLDLRAGATFRF